MQTALPSDDVEVEDPRWEMPDSSGRARVHCTFVSRSEHAPNAIVCRIEVIHKYWPRGLIDWPIETVNDFHVVLSQVLLDLDALKALRERLVEWHVNPSSFSMELGARRQWQSFTLAIGHDENLIYSIDKPACMLTYADGSSMEGHWSFIVDQSCIRLCAEDLGAFVRSVQALPTT